MKYNIDTGGKPRAFSVPVSEAVHRELMEPIGGSQVKRALFAAAWADTDDRCIPAWGDERKYLSLWLSPGQRKAIQAAADACGLSATQWVRLIATAHLSPLLEQLKEARKILEGK
jgi:hypothetical protein